MRTKFSILFIAILLSSCGEEKQTTYQVVNNSEGWETELPDYNGTLYGTNMYYFIDDNSVDIIKLGNLAPGDSSEIIEVRKEITKVKVSFTLLPGSQNYHNTYYNFRYFYTL